MNWPMMLLAYVARRFALSVLIVISVFAIVAFSIDLADMFRRTSERDVTTAIVFSMSALKLPDIVQQLFPFAVLFGAIFTFAQLSRSHELVAARAAGVSAWQFLCAPLVVAVLMGSFAVTIFNPLAASLLAQYTRLEARYIRGEASQLAVSANGLWLRQGTAENQAVIHALRVAQQGEQLEDVLVIRYDGLDRFTGRIDAASATLQERQWLFKQAWVSGTDGRPVYLESYELPTDLTPEQIEESFTSPSTISFWELPRFIANAENAGFSATRHRLYWYSLMWFPILLSAMVFVAASFSFRLTRLGGTSQLVVAGTMSGLGIYFLQDVTRAMGQTGILPMLLAAGAPSAVAILLGMTFLFHEEDG
ncbi:MAG: LPS export ABC transporter permease LptG [Micropepsaceae bacterium]